MFNKALLNSEVQDFIHGYKEDLPTLAFSGSPFEDISVQELIQQIESRNKTAKKLPTWYNTPKILYPPKINLEQTSSEITAEYKASLINGETLADITGGFGVDSYFFSKRFLEVSHFETNIELSHLAKHNFEVLNALNVICNADDGLKNALNHSYSVIYADPSRRNDSKEKVFFLKDCTPNIPDNISTLLNHCETFLLKTSPMLDISVGLNELNGVSEIHVIAVENEVKELLWLCQKNNEVRIEIKTINFTKSGNEEFQFNWQEASEATYSPPQEYLYEPNAAILKSGAFDLVSEKFELNKLHKNTHLYTNSNLIEFPGRKFKIEKVVPYNRPDIRAALSFKKANVTIRNFPESVSTLRKKWKIEDGGDVYLFFTTNCENRKQMLICSKI